MKLNNGDIWLAEHLIQFGEDGKPTVRNPLGELMEMKIPVMCSYKLAQLAKKLGGQGKIIEEVRFGLVKKYGKDDGNGRITIPESSPEYAKFGEEFSELLNQEIEIVFEKVKLPEKVAATCDKCNHNMDKPLEIEPKILMALEKFIEV